MRSTRHGNPFSFCQTWGQAVFFRSEAGSSYLSQYGENGGGRTRENPRFRKTNPGPKKDSMDAFLADENEEEKAVCATCGAEVQEGVIRCPNGHELDWPEETKENPQEVEVEEEPLLEKAARMDNETLARFIEERQRDIDQMLERKVKKW